MRKLWVTMLVFFLGAAVGYGQTGRATINAGALKTDLDLHGMMGDSSASLKAPAGFFPYHDYKALMRVGSLWLGGSTDDKRHFGVSAGYRDDLGKLSNEWRNVAGQITAAIPGMVSPLELSLDLVDTVESANQGYQLGIEADLTVHQWSYAPVDKFYVLNYSFRNSGIQQVDSLYAGLYHLPSVFRDAAQNSSTLNFCGFDVSPDPINGGNRSLLWVTADSVSCANGFGVDPLYLGFRLLEATSPEGIPAPVSGVASWSGLRMEPYTDASPLNPYSKYYYLSRGKLDAGDIRKVNVPATTVDDLTLDFFGQVVSDVEGVWDVNDTNHLGTNYYTGGSFDSERGLITLGTPKAPRTAQVNSEETWPWDTLTVGVSVTPIYSVEGVYDNPLDSGTNYYTGGNFNPATGVITLGTPYFGGNQLYVDYRYRINNVTVTYNYYYSKSVTTPWDSYTLQIDPNALQQVEGVYWAKDSTSSGTNYFAGGSFDKSTGMIFLGSPIDDDTMTYNRYATQTYDESWGPQDDTVMVNWLDPTKVVEILGVYDEGNVDRYPGGSYDPSTGTITLGIPFAGLDYWKVWVSYRYVATPNVWVKAYRPELSARSVLMSLGPWDMAPGDSARAVFAVVAGHTMEELQASSDSALYIWKNPTADVSASSGSASGTVERTAGRGPIAGAKVVAFQSGSAVDSSYTDYHGRYFASNLTGGIYDSLTASAFGYLPFSLSGIAVVNGQNTGGCDLTLTSQRADLSGTIVRANGITPVANAKVDIRGANTDSTFSDNQGRYKFIGLNISGTDTLIFSAPYCLTDTVPGIALFEDAATVCDRIMHSPTGWIDGMVTKLDGITPVSGAAVRAATPTDTVSALTGKDGSYSLGGLNAGAYDLMVSADWFAPSVLAAVAVSADSTARGDFALKQANNITTLIWTKKSAMPDWLYGSSSAMVGGKIYLFGGRSFLGASSACYRYDPAADTVGGDPWNRTADMPSARYGMGAAAVGDTIIYLVGGYDRDSLPLSTLQAYLPASDSWLTGLPSMPTPRAFMGVASISDTVYAAGGFNNLAAGLDTVEAYLASSSSWITPKALAGGDANGRAGIGIVALDSFGVKRLHCVGGQKLDGSILQTHTKYNPITNAWVTRASAPWLVSFSAAVSVNDSLYLTGGRNNSDGYLNKAVAYTPFANNWTTISNLPTTLAYHAGTAKDSTGIWLMGGKPSNLEISDQLYYGYKAGGITGLCTTTKNGPMSGAEVVAWRGPRAKNSEVTDGDGYYTLSGLEPGVYNLRITKAGVIDTTIYGVAVKWGMVTEAPVVTGVTDGRPLASAASFALHPAYPNPSRGHCQISYQIPVGSRVELSVYNILGQKVKTLVSGHQSAGSHTIKWAGDDYRGQPVANGIYLYRLQTEDGRQNRTAVRKLVILK